MSVRKRILRSGSVRWIVDYRDGSGKRRSKQFPTKAAAVIWRDATGVAVRSGVHTPSSQSITLKAAGKLWLKTIEFERKRAPATVKQYKEHLKAHICDPEIGIGAIKISALTTARVKAFYQDMVEHKSLPLGDKVLKSVKAILGEAQVQGFVASNAALPFRPAKQTHKNKRANIPPKKAIVKLLDSAPNDWKAMLMTATLCGLRAGELRAVTWDDINFATGIIRVNKAADIYRNIRPPKSAAGIREVPMSDSVMAVLKAWKLRCKKSDLNLVFPNKKGKVMAHNSIHQNLWPDLMTKLGFVADKKPDFRFHDLRHAAASLFIESGANPKRLTAIMGHSSVAMSFDLYGHLWEDNDADQALAARAEAALFGGNLPA